MASEGKRGMLEWWECEGQYHYATHRTGLGMSAMAGSPGEKPIHLSQGLSLLQCKNDVKDIFILNHCNKKKTKTHFSERSRFT